MSSKIKSFYIRLLQVLGALYFGGVTGSIIERVFKSVYLHSSFQFKEIWSAFAHIPKLLLTALFQNFSLPEKLVWGILYVICGVYSYRAKNIKWFPILIALLSCLWVFYESRNFYFF